MCSELHTYIKIGTIDNNKICTSQQIKECFESAQWQYFLGSSCSTVFMFSYKKKLQALNDNLNMKITFSLLLGGINLGDW